SDLLSNFAPFSFLVPSRGPPADAQEILPSLTQLLVSQKQRNTKRYNPLGGGSSMNVNVRRFAAVALFAAGVTAVLPGTAAAQMVKGKAEALDALSVRSDRLNVSGGIDSIDALSSALAPTVNNSWNQFRASHGEWTAAIDSRNGLIASAEGAGIPWVPGRGNRLTKADIASLLGGRNK